MFITMAQCLQVIGQSPVKHGNVSAVEKLRVAKSTFPMFGGGGGMQDMLKQVTGGGGIGSMLTNPMAALSGIAGGQLGSMISKVQGMIQPVINPQTKAVTSSNPAASGLLTALNGSDGIGGGSTTPTGLVAALGSLTSTADTLSGVASTTQYGLNSVMGHADLFDLGLDMPADISMDLVLGPVFSSDHLNDMLDFMSAYVGANPTLDVQSNLSTILAWAQDATNTTNGIVSDSNTALAHGETITLALGAVSAVTSALAGGIPGGTLGNFLSAIVDPDAVSTIAEFHANTEAMFAAAKASNILDSTVT